HDAYGLRRIEGCAAEQPPIPVACASPIASGGIVLRAAVHYLRLMKLYIVVAALLLLVGCTNYEAQWAELEQQSWSRVQGVADHLAAWIHSLSIHQEEAERARPDTSSL